MPVARVVGNNQPINTWSVARGHILRNYSGGISGDGAWRGMVTIVELNDPRP